MKRFEFDWENNRALKFDDHFKFPLILNMEPYTLEGVSKRESFISPDELISNSTFGNSNNGILTKSSLLTQGNSAKIQF